MLISSVIDVAAARPVINSIWTETPPTIDGAFMSGEWNSPQIFIENTTTTIETYVYFMNDKVNLYVMVDAVGDTTDGGNDECLLVFHNNGTIRLFEIVGASGKVEHNDFYAVIGYGTSPNSAINHKIYEWSIPLTFITEPGKSVDFCSPPWKHGIASMPFDSSTNKDNVWPSGLDERNPETWAIFKPASALPVGGEIVDLDALEIIAFYLQRITPHLFVLAIAVAIGAGILTTKRFYKTNYSTSMQE